MEAKQMENDKAVAKLKEYKAIVHKYLPYKKVNTQKDPSLHSAISGACLEALVILEGDEDKLRECIECAKDDESGMGWGYDFDEYNGHNAISYIKALAQLLKVKNK
ncbi:hypothetical protein HY772_09375 [Candidatus Woesearchaeota archaeon]|nr:hypothetical protein [Candidatus Woesearchaeota archaeon]